jgi:hypothetical protein
MNKTELLRALQIEIRRHDFGTFVDNPPSVAQGGNGVVVPGCAFCKKRLNTSGSLQITLRTMCFPLLLDRLSVQSQNS